ncbi:hypothetical protein O6H91_19G072800 [Diphasiastrum complanatum]|uniref:Uncharacterized protein n=1 Tax=Diphasiastrum complanatum TaxID=34168 RepID=A0ACC2AWQ2_DIPCM|nr:hypothetical protein O6H91_19G072800 [Diphasiastrum complanatum]
MQAATGSPARASHATASTSSAAAGHATPTDDISFTQIAEDVTLTEDRKAETQQALMETLLASLRKEEKLLDADNWMFTALRSQFTHTS